MDTPERLAAYLDGDLDDAEAARLEAELAEDPELRGRLEALRRADRGLRGLPAEPPRDGFEQRLSAAVGNELDAQLAAGGGADQGHDELAASREAAGPRDGAPAVPTWASRLAAAAAAIAVLGGVGLVATDGLTGGGTDTAGGGGPAGEAAVDAPVPTPASPEAVATAAAAGPAVSTSGRHYDTATVGELTDDPRFEPLAGRRVSGATVQRLADRYAEALARRATPPAPDGGQAPDDRDGPARATPGATAADLEAVGRCLPDLLGSAAGPVVPMFAETARFRGGPAIVYGLLSPHPDTNALTQREIWVLDPRTCEVRHLAQAASPGPPAGR